MHPLRTDFDDDRATELLEAAPLRVAPRRGPPPKAPTPLDRGRRAVEPARPVPTPAVSGGAPRVVVRAGLDLEPTAPDGVAPPLYPLRAEGARRASRPGFVPTPAARALLAPVPLRVSPGAARRPTTRVVGDAWGATRKALVAGALVVVGMSLGVMATRLGEPSPSIQVRGAAALGAPSGPLDPPRAQPRAEARISDDLRGGVRPRSLGRRRGTRSRRARTA